MVWSQYWSSTNVIFQNIYAFLLSWPPPFLWFFVKSLTFPHLPLTPRCFQFSTLVEWSPCILSYCIFGQTTSVLTMTICKIINAISDIDSDKGWMMLQCSAITDGWQRLWVTKKVWNRKRSQSEVKWWEDGRSTPILEIEWLKRPWRSF